MISLLAEDVKNECLRAPSEWREDRETVRPVPQVPIHYRLGDSGALFQRVLELPLALLLQQVIEGFGLRVRFLLQYRLVGLQHAFNSGESCCPGVGGFVRILDLERTA